MRFHPTIKLAKKLRIDALESSASVPEDLATWYANLFRVDRVQYMLFINAPTLFSVLVYGRGVTNRGRMCDVFDAALRDYLTPYGLYEPYCLAVGAELLSREFYKTSNRSVLGTMNDRIAACQWYRADDERYLLYMSNLLNQTPSKPIEFRLPVRAFIELIEQSLR